MMPESESYKLWKEIKDLSEDIYNDIEHGECLYDIETLDYLANKLDSLKHLAYKYHSVVKE